MKPQNITPKTNPRHSFTYQPQEGQNGRFVALRLVITDFNANFAPILCNIRRIILYFY
jgi:hypothetical protein